TTTEYSGFIGEHTHHNITTCISLAPDCILQSGFFVLLMVFGLCRSLSKIFLFFGSQIVVSMITPAKGRKTTPPFCGRERG
ncbi:MAG: hypothetical protein ACK5NU_14495, partial [Fusobacterium ulcerans]|uniref:hypothetical protein n=1 Tax=Fusobacterium ulcerans TaxID=861 RepID=UPI003A83AF54